MEKRFTIIQTCNVCYVNASQMLHKYIYIYVSKESRFFNLFKAVLVVSNQKK